MGRKMDDIEAMFSDLLGEMDLLTQSLGVETVPPEAPLQKEVNYSIGFKDLNEWADLAAEIGEPQQSQKGHSNTLGVVPGQPSCFAPHHLRATQVGPPAATTLPPIAYSSSASPAPSFPAAPSPSPAPIVTSTPVPSQPSKPLTKEEEEAQAKADKIKLALEKLKEAKVKKLVVKVIMTDNSSKTLMVDETQTVRDILDNLFEKTHCDCNVDWCLYEENTYLQIERIFEDHDNMVECLSQWTRDSENRILFIERKDKYAVFKNPQNFYFGRKEKKEMKEKDKESLLEENFCGTSIIVPDLEGALYLKEDGKKSWKQRYFLLRASGIYYVPKGKTKTSRDLACFVQFDNVNVHYGTDYKNKYKAPTDYCFVLKHPQIQKESNYIKYLCCDDRWSLQLWVMGIRIAKYGKILYDNYRTAVQKAGLASRWSNLANVEAIASSVKTKAVPTQANGCPAQATPPVTSVSSAFSDAWKRADMSKANPAESKPAPAPPAPTMQEILPPPPPDPIMTQQECFLPPPPPDFYDLPPPPDDFSEPPPDFLPPPPPCPNAPPPPPPPLLTPAPAPVLKKVGPPPPKRTTPERSGSLHGGEQQDFMSELMKAMQKKSSK
ncbi:amyloid beta A4 precursor protein-binding family B member 1-interacting protein [Erpetoichthys calabaricus]|uniref:amyloid beta A4 precursor protein-binding family B member 1-interacting protein n=1 Tax=Erpetoichthys calabaricus TaxID=27687 RepID=UPI0022345DAC|nr:amyloid beta A4 precursor protein-binding family B member 1-interacting protein [Erpetoichthys calabaricus]